MVLLGFQFDKAVVQLTHAQQTAQFVTGGTAALSFVVAVEVFTLSRQQQVEQLLLGAFFSLEAHFFRFLFTNHDDGQLDQIAYHTFNVAADIADLGEFAGFDFDKRRLSQFGQASGNLGFTDTGGADHDDVFR